MALDRFLLVKAWSYILWSDVDHVLGLLLVAEMTGRIPVIYWPTHYLNNGFVQTNGFEMYFEPINNYTIHNLANPEYSYFPPIWNSDNLMVDDNSRATFVYRNIGDILCSRANVVVVDVFYSINELIPHIKKNNPAYGMTPEQVYHYLLSKYIRVKPDIDMEIQGYYNSWIKDGHPVLAVHVRRADKAGRDEKDEKLRRRKSGRIKYDEPNKPYHNEIHKYIEKYSIKKIFLLTDCQNTLNEYKERYGPMLVYADCKRLQSCDDMSLMENPMINRRRGIEIIKDTYVAAKCDFFIGNDFSSLSRAVARLKDWPDKNVKLLYRIYKNKKYPVNAALPVREQENIFRRFIKKIKSVFGGRRLL